VKAAQIDCVTKPSCPATTGGWLLEPEGGLGLTRGGVWPPITTLVRFIDENRCDLVDWAPQAPDL
jgi:hypothetical protein